MSFQKNKITWWTAVVLIAAMLCSICGMVFAADNVQDEKQARVTQLLQNISASYQDTAEDWKLIDMLAYGQQEQLTQAEAWQTAAMETISGMLEGAAQPDANIDLSACEKYSIAFTGFGRDARALVSEDGTTIDLIELLSTYQIDAFTHVSEGIYALLAYDSGRYTAEGRAVRDELIGYILSQRDADGLWGYSWDGVYYTDYDSAGMALCALAFYQGMSADDTEIVSAAGLEEAQTAAEEIVAVLSERQQPDGGWGNTCTNAMVIIGLSAMGIDADTDARFVKEQDGMQKSALDALLSTALQDGSGFGLMDAASYNDLATEQAFRALVAYNGFKETERAFSPMHFRGLGADTGAATPEPDPSASASAAPTASAQPTSKPGSGGGSGSGPVEEQITVSFTLKGDTVHGDEAHSGAYPTWITETDISLDESSSVGDVLRQMLDANGYTCRGLEDGYVTSITSPDGVTLAEQTNGAYSGWLYRVNDISPEVGMNDYELKDGDVICFYYTDDYREEYEAEPTPSPSPTRRPSGSNGGSVGRLPIISGGSQSSPTPAPGSSPSVIPEADWYLDVPEDNWAKPYIEQLTQENILAGDTDGMFRPDAPVTRAEFVTILSRVSGADAAERTVPFADVRSGDWYYAAVAWAFEAGIVNGVTENSFAPDDPISRQDLCVMLMRYAEKNGGIDLTAQTETVVFSDTAEIAAYAADAVAALQSAGIINGVGDGRFAPNENATRAEAAKLIALSLLK